MTTQAQPPTGDPLASAEGRPRDRVDVTVPADSSYVPTVRLAAAGLAARCDLTIDEIEDLRLAVDEACALLLPAAREGSRLSAGFLPQAMRLDVEVSVTADDGAEPDRESYAWTVLRALAEAVDVSAGDSTLTISFVKRRGTAAE